MIIEVFPDHCSTGLWDAISRANIDPESKGIDDKPLLIALKYWHWTWEFLLVEGRLSASAAKTWLDDGACLVASLNERYAGTHAFVYRADLCDIPVKTG